MQLKTWKKQVDFFVVRPRLKWTQCDKVSLSQVAQTKTKELRNYLSFRCRLLSKSFVLEKKWISYSKIAVGSAVCIFYWLIRNISNTRCSLSWECLSNFSQISQFQFLAVKKRQLKAEIEIFHWTLVDILNWAKKWVLLIFLVRQ